MDEFVVFSTELIRALIGASQLIGPLLVFDRHAAHTNAVLVLALITLAFMRFVQVAGAAFKVLTELEALGGASEDVVEFAV